MNDKYQTILQLFSHKYSKPEGILFALAKIEMINPFEHALAIKWPEHVQSSCIHVLESILTSSVFNQTTKLMISPIKSIRRRLN